jgi:glycosyltransferase involved in cell wall biosynthesis
MAVEPQPPVPAADRRDGIFDLVIGADSLKPPLTGIGRYTQQLVTGIARREGVIGSITCFAGPAWLDGRGALARAAGPSPERTGARGLARMVRGVPGVYAARHAVTGFALKARAPRFGRAVYHEPNFVLRPLGLPAVVSCHDLSFIRYPEHHPRERVRHLERHLPRSLEQAARILTDSLFVRDEVIQRYGVHPDRIAAVPLGVSEAFRPHSVEECRPALDRHGLAHDRYLLAVTTVEPRKNLGRLLEAYSHLPAALRRRFPLVVAGAKGWSTTALESQMSRLQQAGEMKRLGYVAEEDLPALYAGCAAFAYPSLYEGFGLPPLEAMACGAPVVASGTSSIPEVVGNAGILVDPEDVDAMTEGLRRALEDEALRRELRAKGPERAALFTWDRCVERTIEVYRQVLK